MVLWDAENYPDYQMFLETASRLGVKLLLFATLMSTRRRRAAAGGCVNCRFQCQHAMTGPRGDRRLWLVTTADRREPAEPGPAVTGEQAPLPVRSVPVLLPMPEVRVPAPRWPDRPLHRVPG